MMETGTGNDGNNLTDEEKINRRISLVKQLQDAGYKKAVSISKWLKDNNYEYLNISEATIGRDIQRIREEGRDFIENRVLTGEFIVDHHEALQEFKKIGTRCSEEIAIAESNYNARNVEINAISTEGENDPTEADVMRLKLQNESIYHSVKQNNERILMQATKEYTQLANKTETVWSLKQFIKENTTKTYDKPELQNIINKLQEKEEEEKGEE